MKSGVTFKIWEKTVGSKNPNTLNFLNETIKSIPKEKERQVINELLIVCDKLDVPKNIRELKVVSSKLYISNVSDYIMDNSQMVRRAAFSADLGKVSTKIVTMRVEDGKKKFIRTTVEEALASVKRDKEKKDKEKKDEGEGNNKRYETSANDIERMYDWYDMQKEQDALDGRDLNDYSDDEEHIKKIKGAWAMLAFEMNSPGKALLVTSTICNLGIENSAISMLMKNAERNWKPFYEIMKKYDQYFPKETTGREGADSEVMNELWGMLDREVTKQDLACFMERGEEEIVESKSNTSMESSLTQIEKEVVRKKGTDVSLTKMCVNSCSLLWVSVQDLYKLGSFMSNRGRLEFSPIKCKIPESTVVTQLSSQVEWDDDVDSTNINISPYLVAFYIRPKRETYKPNIKSIIKLETNLA